MAVSSIFSLLSFSPSHPPSLRASLSPYHSSPVYNTAKDGWAQPVKTSVHQRCTSPLHSSPSDNFDLAPAVFPSLTHPNTPYSSAYNAEVIVEENEPEERLINRFRREVMKTGLIYECRRRRFFENKQEEKKRKSREAAKRNSRSGEERSGKLGVWVTQSGGVSSMISERTLRTKMRGPGLRKRKKITGNYLKETWYIDSISSPLILI
ncbi:unnamed protein product [Cuscuta epithymum]|uniref:Ribosomal protein S21 n=1 Tax=Cuscuta epithymum TaxID=186058 RepID=A0AAV0GEM0_9ASTE|nr:unnamed protein product [Cuscuta epithymum]CAH9146290.1 unnamed protein product [Cuscuta epithymum]